MKASRSTSLVFTLVASTIAGACAARTKTIETPVPVSHNDCVTAVQRTTTKGKDSKPVKTEILGIVYDQACGDRQIEAAKIRSVTVLETAQIRAAAEVITGALSEAKDPVAKQRLLAAIISNMESSDERVRTAQAEANAKAGITAAYLRDLRAKTQCTEVNGVTYCR